MQSGRRESKDMWGKALRMLGVALTDFTRSNCPYVAAGIAYWTLFSVFPLALAGIAILGFLYSTPEDQTRVVEGIIELVPVSEAYLAPLVEEVARARGTLGGLAVIGLLWTGTAVFSAVRKGINHAWHIGRPHYFLLERAIDMVMLLGVAVLALIHVLFTTNLLGVATLAGKASGSDFWVVFKVAFELLALAVTIGAFMLLYRYVPNTRVVWRDIWIGAVVGATLFQGVRIVFTWFLSNVADFNVVYGSLGALMAVLVRAYLSSIAIMLGAQMAYTYRGVFGSHAGEVELPEPRSRASRPSGRRGIRGILMTVVGWLLPPKKDDE